MTTDDGDAGPSPPAAVIYEDAERIRRRELGTALRKLDARGDLDGEQRDAIEALTEALLARFLAAPTRGIGEADDPAALRATVRLFAPDAAGGRDPDRPRPQGVRADGD